MATPLGNFDTVSPTKGCTGWALSPDNPNLTLAIHFYANAKAGSPGSVLVGSTIANLPRPDVNKATGYPGNYGFDWSFPFDLITPCQIGLYAYAIDPDGGTNPLLNGSPLTVPLLTGSISNEGAQTPIVITATSRLCGAINSLTFNGNQFVYPNSHGAALQSAINSQNASKLWNAECFNPTEAGAYSDDMEGSGNCTSSHLLAFSASGAQLTTQSNMAFYAPPGGVVTTNCPTGTKNTTVLSGVILSKTVTLAFNSQFPNVIQYDVNFQFPANYPYPEYNTFEVIAWYLPNSGSSIFNTFLQYNQNTGVTTNVTSSYPEGHSDETNNIVLQANGTAATAYCAGVYSPAAILPAVLTYDQANNGADTKIGIVQRINPVIPGNTYSFTAYLVVGTVQSVTENIVALIAAYP